MTAIVQLEPRKVELQGHGFVELDLPMPPMGGKCWVLGKKGQFLLQRGAGMLVTVNCAHAGSGTLEFFDGVPDDDGLFHARKITVREYGEIMVPGERDDETLKYWTVRNGRSLKRDNPPVMGAWMCNAGFFHGLTVRHYGGQNGVPCIATIVWMPHRGTQAQASTAPTTTVPKKK